MKIAKVSTSHIQAVTGTTFVATLSSLLFGYATAVISGVVDALDHNFIEPLGLTGSVSHVLLGLTVASALVGTILGALVAGRTADFLGRKRSMLFASVLFLVSAAGSAFPEFGFAPMGTISPEFIGPFIGYRMVGGVAVGIASMIAPMYVGEFAPSAVRGQLGAYQQIAIIGGMVIAYFVNWGITLQGDDVWVLQIGWRYMMVSLAIPALAFFWLSFSVPESPKWLVRTGRVDKARRALARSAEPEEVDAMIAELAHVDTEDRTLPVFSFGKRVVLVGIALCVFQQLVGINTVLYFGPTIFKNMGFHMDDAFLAAVVGGVITLMGTMTIVLVVDKVGRKPLLISGALVMGISMIALGSLFNAEATGFLGVIAVCFYLLGFAISFGPIVWIMMTEMFPHQIRGQAMSMAVAAQWGANLLVSSTFPLLLGNGGLVESFHHGFPFFLYGGCGLLAAFVVMRYVPETKGVDHDSLGALWRREEIVRN
jgi:SP family xylose:H+ symportor-like MFS transporter